MTKVFISLLTFNDNKATLECLGSLENLNKESFELSVVVVDNASEEPFVAIKRYKNFNMKVLRNSQNLGFSAGHNIGINYSLEQEANFIIILNNDTEVDKDLVSHLLKEFDENTGVAVPKIYFAKGYEFHKNRYKNADLGKVIWYAGGQIDWGNVIASHIGVDEVDSQVFNLNTETELATGCCMMVKKDVFEKVGLLDEDYFLYYEDADFSVRVKKAGYKINFVPKALLWHKNAASTGGSGSELQDYYITRNRLIFGFRHAPLRSRIALFRESIRLFFGGRRWQRTAVSDFYLRRLGKGSFKK